MDAFHKEIIIVYYSTVQSEHTALIYTTTTHLQTLAHSCDPGIPQCVADHSEAYQLAAR